MRATTWQHVYAHLFTEDQLASIPVEESAARLRRQIEVAPDRFHTLVAALGDAVVGFAGLGTRDFSADETDVGELYAIYVLPHLHGRGVGRALMAETVSRLRNDGFGEAVLWVFEDNPRTRRFTSTWAGAATAVRKTRRGSGPPLRLSAIASRSPLPLSSRGRMSPCRPSRSSRRTATPTSMHSERCSLRACSIPKPSSRFRR